MDTERRTAISSTGGGGLGPEGLDLGLAGSDQGVVDRLGGGVCLLGERAGPCALPRP
jgi:hypothetical protein